MGVMEQEAKELYVQMAHDEAERARQVAELPFGISFKLMKAQYDGRPYVKATCSHCKTILNIENPEYVWVHCGMGDPIPADIKEQFIARKQGSKPSLLQRVFGKSEPAPQLDSF